MHAVMFHNRGKCDCKDSLLLLDTPRALTVMVTELTQPMYADGAHTKHDLLVVLSMVPQHNGTSHDQCGSTVAVL